MCNEMGRSFLRRCCFFREATFPEEPPFRLVKFRFRHAVEATESTKLYREREREDAGSLGGHAVLHRTELLSACPCNRDRSPFRASREVCRDYSTRISAWSLRSVETGSSMLD